jgi:hypothetical protein
MTYSRKGLTMTTQENTLASGRTQARRGIVVALAIAAAVVAGMAPTATAAPLKVITSSSVRGEYAATSVHATRRSALYLRAYGKGLQGGAGVTCVRGVRVASSSFKFRPLVSGRLYRMPTRPGWTCSMAATVSGRGSLRVQVLA